MKPVGSPILIALTLAMTLAAPADARGKIERACLLANRPAASRALCACVQEVAASLLSRSEQSKVAKFFTDPHLSQELRQSARHADERLWAKYQQFGSAVETYCAAYAR